MKSEGGVGVAVADEPTSAPTLLLVGAHPLLHKLTSILVLSFLEALSRQIKL